MEQAETRQAVVFVFYEDGSGVDAYESLVCASGDLEAIDVKNGDYAFFTLRGQRVTATVSGKFQQDVSLRATDEYNFSELQARLMRACRRLAWTPPWLARHFWQPRP